MNLEVVRVPHVSRSARPLAGRCHLGPMSYSVWLLPPPASPLHDRTQAKIRELSQRFSGRGASAPFAPHVTLLGGFPADTHAAAKIKAKELAAKLGATDGPAFWVRALKALSA